MIFGFCVVVVEQKKGGWKSNFQGGGGTNQGANYGLRPDLLIGLTIFRMQKRREVQYSTSPLSLLTLACQGD